MCFAPPAETLHNRPGAKDIICQGLRHKRQNIQKPFQMMETKDSHLQTNNGAIL
jgi:hypothetical protein